jgi:hypothetical protein
VAATFGPGGQAARRGGLTLVSDGDIGQDRLLALRSRDRIALGDPARAFRQVTPGTARLRCCAALSADSSPPTSPVAAPPASTPCARSGTTDRRVSPTLER